MVRRPLLLIFTFGSMVVVACSNDSTGGGAPAPHADGGSEGSDAGDAASDATGCPAAATLPAQFQSCIVQSCCSTWTSCSGDPACIAAFQCYEANDCAKADANAQACLAACEADAGQSGSSEFNALLTCVKQSCGGADGGH